MILLVFILLLIPSLGYTQTWTSLSTNTIESVRQKIGGKTVTETKNGNANISDETTGGWNGGAFCPISKRLILPAHGGDHDGASNEVTVWNFNSKQWTRDKDATVDIIPSMSQAYSEIYTDTIGKYGPINGKYPASRHTYGGNVCVSLNDGSERVVMLGGITWGAASGGGWAGSVFEYDLNTKSYIGPTDQIWADNAGWGVLSVFDTINKRVLFQTGSALRAYDFTKPFGSRITTLATISSDSDMQHRTAFFDSKKNRFVLVGAGHLKYWSLGPGGISSLQIPIPTGAPWGQKPGAVLDLVTGEYVIWNSGSKLHIVNPDTFAVTTETLGGIDPGGPPATGTFNRMAHVMPEDVFIIVNCATCPVMGAKRARGTIPPIVSPPVVVSPPSGSLDNFPTRVLVALEGPEDSQGIAIRRGMKHVTAAHHPPSGRIYFIGGDYRSKGNPISQSYVQEGWSLDLAERWRNKANSAAGWRHEWPYCGAKGGVQPKHPDFVGWAWDSLKKWFWMIPGFHYHLEVGQDVCPGETSVNTSDSIYKVGIMSFTPDTNTWALHSMDLGPDWVESWMSVLDSVKNRFIRLGHSGGSGGRYNILDLNTFKWTGGNLGPNALNQDIRCQKEYLAADHISRYIYCIDGFAGRLHRFSMDTFAMVDLGAVPGGSLGTENDAHSVWDSTAKRLVWLRDGQIHVYEPLAKTWESIPAVTVPPGLPTTYRMAVYDPGNNVTLFMGGVTPINPNMLLFRYAACGGVGEVPCSAPSAPPVVTPPPPPPPPPPSDTKPIIDIKCPSTVTCKVTVP